MASAMPQYRRKKLRRLLKLTSNRSFISSRRTVFMRKRSSSDKKNTLPDLPGEASSRSDASPDKGQRLSQAR